MEPVRKRSPSEVLRRGYSDEEIVHIYELARLFLELGELSKADIVVTGLIEIAPEFSPARLAKGYVALHEGNFELAVDQGRQMLALAPLNPQAMLLLVSAFLGTGDFNQAGTLLGEVGETIEAGSLTEPTLVRYYRLQLARYQTRGG